MLLFGVYAGVILINTCIFLSLSKFPYVFGVEWWESTAQDHALENSSPREESQDAAGPWWFATLTEAHVVAERNRTTVATRYLAASCIASHLNFCIQPAQASTSPQSASKNLNPICTKGRHWLFLRLIGLILM